MTGVSRQALFSGAEAPPAHLALDSQRLDAWLRSHLDFYRGPLEIEKFRGGQSNPTYRLTTPAARYVLRKKPPGPLLPSAHSIDREYRVIAALHAAGFPVPRPYLLCDDESVVGTMFYLVEHVDGRVFWEVDLPGVSPGERSAIYDSMNATLAALHSIDPLALGLGDFGRPGNYLQRQFDRWTKQYRAAQLADVPDMDWLIAELPGRIPESSASRLVHGDYGLHNIVIHKTEPQVAAVLDWEISTLGDPLGDIGHHLTAWHLPPDLERGSVSSLVGCDLAVLGIPTADAYLDRYLERTGAADFDRRFVLGFGLFRYAAIIQGVMKRAQSGTGANQNMMHTQARVGLLAAAARRTIEGR
ncbi:MAG TPA: phosphotransferase family protein [Stellaceae bacterium]|nr:phosphotransferase family protein [Stellaceae bacterium]